MGGVQAGKALAVDARGAFRPYLRTKNILDGQIVLEDVLWMPMTDEEFERFRVEVGDVLLNEGQSLDLVGRCAMYNGELGAPCAMQNQLVRFRADEHTSPAFAAHLFRRCQHRGVFSAIATQTTSVAHLGVKRFSALSLGWPRTRFEQDAIAEALSDADALIASLEQLIAKKRLIKQGVMQALLSGRQRLSGFNGRWVSSPLGSLGAWQSGGTPSKKAPQYWGGNVPWVSPKDMKSVRLVDSLDRVTEEAIGNGTRLLPAKSLLVVVRGMILAHSVPVASAERPIAFNQDVKGLIPRADVESDFVLWWLVSNEQLLLSKTTTSTHGTRRLPTEDLFALQIALPGLEEQTAIARVITDLDLEVQALAARLKKVKQVKQGMMQQLLTGRIRLV